MYKEDANLMDNITTTMEFGTNYKDALEKAQANGKLASEVTVNQVDNPLPTGDYRKVIGWGRLIENNEAEVPEKRREIASKIGTLLRDQPAAYIAMEHRSLETRTYRHSLGQKNKRGKVYVFFGNENGNYESIETFEKKERIAKTKTPSIEQATELLNEAESVIGSLPEIDITTETI